MNINMKQQRQPDACMVDDVLEISTCMGCNEALDHCHAFRGQPLQCFFLSDLEDVKIVTETDMEVSAAHGVAIIWGLRS